MPSSLDRALAALEPLRAAGDHAAVRRRAEALAVRFPDDPRAVAAAAYANDRLGRERAAVDYYQRAFELGGPPERAGFLLGFGSTLRNVGRIDDAIAILGQAVIEAPTDAALRAFLALALGSAGHATLALATMLEAGLLTSPTAFAPYRRALTAYLGELQTAATPGPATPAAPGPAAPAARPRRPRSPRRASPSRRSR